jgi:hypothetical protein
MKTDMDTHATIPGAHAARPLLVTYDIADDRRRNRLHRLLRGFGEPLQKSVFICWVDPARRNRLEALIADFATATHRGGERIDCIQASGLAPPPEDAWVIE